MGIEIVPRTDLTPLRGEVVQPDQAFRPPAAYERTREHDAIVVEAQHNGLQQHGIFWQQTLANQLNSELAISAAASMIRTSVVINQLLPLAATTDAGTQKILGDALSALLQQSIGNTQQGSIVAQQNIGEVSSRPPTGQAVLKEWAKQEKEEREREEREIEREREERRLAELRRREQERKPGLLELLFGR